MFQAAREIEGLPNVIRRTTVQVREARDEVAREAAGFNADLGLLVGDCRSIRKRSRANAGVEAGQLCARTILQLDSDVLEEVANREYVTRFRARDAVWRAAQGRIRAQAGKLA